MPIILFSQTPAAGTYTFLVAGNGTAANQFVISSGYTFYATLEMWGGGGGASGARSGGGGGGYLKTNSLTVTNSSGSEITITVTVGVGGASEGSAGTESSITLGGSNFTASGGGSGIFGSLTRPAGGSTSCGPCASTKTGGQGGLFFFGGGAGGGGGSGASSGDGGDGAGATGGTGGLGTGSGGVGGNAATSGSDGVFPGGGGGGRGFTAGSPGKGANGLVVLVVSVSPILPVELSSFTAMMNKNAVQIDWSVAAEFNNDKFIIEKSLEGELFAPIGEVNGAGTTTEAQNYRFLHHTPSDGINYYRLKQVDFDGTFAYSKVIAINAEGTDQIFAFPNPAKDKMTLQYDVSKGEAQVALFDAQGRQLKARIIGYPGNYEVALPEDLPHGAYVLKVLLKGKIQTIKMIKE